MSTIHKLLNGLRVYLNIKHGSQRLVCWLTGVPTINIIALDDYLIEIHGDYTADEGLSMRQLITREYGLDAADFVHNNL